MINKKTKHAEITTQQIVFLIVLIASFAVIIFFLVRLNPGKTTEDEVCHNSVITRSSNLLLKETIPLNCKTSYVCLSKDGSCEQMTSPEVERVKTKEEVYRVLAEEEANCWWVFGEGKADYIGNEFENDLYCSICSIVAFDDSLDNLFAVNPSSIARANLGIPEDFSNFVIDKEDFYDYLSNTNVSGKDISYLDYFLGLENSKLISEALKSDNYTFGYLDIKRQYLIMMGEFSKVGLFQEIVKGIGKGVLLFLSLPIPVIGGPLAMYLIVSTVTPNSKGYLIGTVMQGESEHYYLSPAIIEANSEDYDNLQCADVKTLA